MVSRTTSSCPSRLDSSRGLSTRHVRLRVVSCSGRSAPIPFRAWTRGFLCLLCCCCCVSHTRHQTTSQSQSQGLPVAGHQSHLGYRPCPRGCAPHSSGLRIWVSFWSCRNRNRNRNTALWVLGTYYGWLRLVASGSGVWVSLGLGTGTYRGYVRVRLLQNEPRFLPEPRRRGSFCRFSVLQAAGRAVPVTSPDDASVSRVCIGSGKKGVMPSGS